MKWFTLYTYTCVGNFCVYHFYENSTVGMRVTRGVFIYFRFIRTYYIISISVSIEHLRSCYLFLCVVWCPLKIIFIPNLYVVDMIMSTNTVCASIYKNNCISFYFRSSQTHISFVNHLKQPRSVPKMETTTAVVVLWSEPMLICLGTINSRRYFVTIGSLIWANLEEIIGI